MAGRETPLSIAVDAMGGDRAPSEIVAGALTASADDNVRIRLVGVPEALAPLVPAGLLTEGRVAIVPSGYAIPEGEAPLAALRARPDASMAVTMRQVATGTADAAVSAGSTGPTLLAAVREIGLLKGVRRACVGRQIFGLHPETFLIDLGPTVDCEPRHLVEFAIIGATYMRVFQGIPEPTVALLSNGREPGKGNRVVKDAAALLERSGLRYVGMVEGDHLMAGAANVVVCDGFVGNVALKTVEGLGRQLAAWCRAELGTALPAPRLTGIVNRVLEATNPIERQGSLPLLGIRGPVVMAHGAADRHAIRAAIGQAANAVRARFVETLAGALAGAWGRLRDQPNQERMTSGSLENQ